MIRDISAMLLRNWHRNSSELNTSGNKKLIHIVNNRLHKFNQLENYYMRKWILCRGKTYIWWAGLNSQFTLDFAVKIPIYFKSREFSCWGIHVNFGNNWRVWKSIDSDLDFVVLPFKGQEVCFHTSLAKTQMNPKVQVETEAMLPISS